jgi:hypothetical protein
VFKFKGHLIPISHVLMFENQFANSIPNFSFDHTFYFITSIEKYKSFLTSTILENFDAILGSQFEPSLLPNILQICYKNSKLLKDYNSEGFSHLEFLWIPFLASSCICGNMIEYKYVNGWVSRHYLNMLPFCVLRLVASPKLELQKLEFW